MYVSLDLNLALGLGFGLGVFAYLSGLVLLQGCSLSVYSVLGEGRFENGDKVVRFGKLELGYVYLCYICVRCRLVVLVRICSDSSVRILELVFLIWYDMISGARIE